MTTGQNVVLTGLVIQIVMFGLFAVVAAVFHVRVRRWPTAAFLERRPIWTKTMVMLYSVSIFILVRSVFRVIEYAMGQDGYLLKHEWTLYVFDGALMFGVVVMFGWMFPSRETLIATKDEEISAQGPSDGERDPQTSSVLQMGYEESSKTSTRETKKTRSTKY